ncbi:unnamed protein product [Gordionus sp. m RMFG-2023]
MIFGRLIQSTEKKKSLSNEEKTIYEEYLGKYKNSFGTFIILEHKNISKTSTHGNINKSTDTVNGIKVYNSIEQLDICLAPPKNYNLKVPTVNFQEYKCESLILSSPLASYYFKHLHNSNDYNICIPFKINLNIWPPLLYYSDESNMMKELKNKYDIAFVASFGKFLSNSVIKAFPLGVYNIHPSLLPKYRGPCPLYHTLLNEDLYTDGPTYAPKLDWIKLLNVNWANTNPLQLIKLYYILGIQYNGLRSKFMGHIVKLLNPFLLCQFKENHDIFLLDQLYSKHLILKKLSNITSLNSQSQSLHVDCDQITRDKPLPGALFYSYQFNSIFIASYQSNNQNSNINWKWIGFKDVKYRGTKMTAFDFYNGYLSKPDYQTEILEGVD